MIETLKDVVAKLAESGFESPRLEARILVAGALQQDPDGLNPFEVFDPIASKKIELLLNRRLKHEPLDKIFGKRAFYKHDFIVNRDVLSPRPETEILVEKALMLLKNMPSAKILDLGVGSGCIIETLLFEYPESCGVGVDISAAALRVAEQNAHKLGVAGRLRFEKKNWFDRGFNLHEKFDLVVSNPPYISSSDILRLESDVKDYDPLVALDGGFDGLASYRRIAALSPKFLKDGGYILLEIGAGQAQDVVQIFSKYLHCVDVAPDLAQIERCVIMQKLVAE